MIEIKRVETLGELQQNMPLFLEGFRQMNKRHKAFDCDEQGFIKTLIGVLGTGPDNAIALATVEGKGVGYGVGFDDTPTYCEKRHFLLWALYVKPEWSKLVTKPLFERAEEYAKEQGYVVMRAYNGRMNGSSFKFFESCFKMRRHRVEFTKEIL